MTLPGIAPALTLSICFFQHADGGLGRDDEPAEHHGERNEQPAVHGQLCTQLRAERRKADVHAGEEQDKANIGIENTDEDLGKAAARQAQQRDLKQEEDRYDRQQWRSPFP